MGRVMMQAYFAIRFLQIALPWIVRPFRTALMWLLVSMSAFWVGVPQATDQMADEGMRRATEAGVPTIWSRELYFAIRVVAFLAILVGWIILSFVTVWIVKWLF